MSKAYLITGAAKRLGKDLAEQLPRAGDTVFVHYNNSEKEALSLCHDLSKRKIKAHALKANIRLEKQCEDLVKQLKAKGGKLDVLINNVGNYSTGNLLEFSPKQFKSILEANLMGSYYLMHFCQDLISKGGSIINLGYTGLLGTLADVHSTAYTISKTGLLILTKSYAELLGPRKINVNMLSPGQLENSVDLPRNLKDWIPMGKAGTSSEISNMIKYLVSPKGKYITGQNIEISGGYMMSLSSHLSPKNNH